MPPRPKFTRDQLQAAALDIVDEEGLAALSMRSLAARLGTGPMTIYNYVRDRDDLDALLIDAVMAAVVLPAPSGDWRADLRAIVRALWRAVRAHRAVIPLILTRRSGSEVAMAPAETLLATLAAGGRSGTDLLVAFRAVTGFVAGLAQAQLAEQDPAVERMQALPADRFPRLVEIAGAAGRLSPDAELDAGLDLLIAGLT